MHRAQVLCRTSGRGRFFFDEIVLFTLAPAAADDDVTSAAAAPRVHLDHLRGVGEPGQDEALAAVDVVRVVAAVETQIKTYTGEGQSVWHCWLTHSIGRCGKRKQKFNFYA